jgi:hypothetical protein
MADLGHKAGSKDLVRHNKGLVELKAGLMRPFLQIDLVQRAGRGQGKSRKASRFLERSLR